MENNYAEYVGAIVQARTKNQKEKDADLVGRVSGIDDFGVIFSYTTYLYSDITPCIAASQIRVAEMGYHLWENPVRKEWHIQTEDIAQIKVLSRR